MNVDDPAVAKDTPLTDYTLHSIEELRATVVDGGYCVGCGACACVPSSCIRMRIDHLGRFQPVVVSDRLDTTSPTLAPATVCPFGDGTPCEDDLAAPAYRHVCQHDQRVGYHLACYAGFVQEQRYRDWGSSGGLVSWVLSELLRLNYVDAVVHVRRSESTDAARPLACYGVSRTEDQVRAGAGSQYYPVEMSSALSEVREVPGRYAFAGLPCYVKAVRLLATHDEQLAHRIAFYIGLFCGHLKTTAFAKLLAWQCGISPETIEFINFRKKLSGRPANKYGIEVTGRTADGHKAHIVRPMAGLLGADWGHGLFKYRACDYCDDVFAETADIAIGDAWLPEYVRDDRGTNVVVTRHPDLETVLSEAAAQGRVWLHPLHLEEVVRSQSANVRHRRDGLAYRLYLADRAGRWRPEKRVQPRRNRLGRATKRIMELRARIAERSHDAFREAFDRKEIDWFFQEMQPLLNEYSHLYSRRKKRAWRRAASHLRAALRKRLLNLWIGVCRVRAKWFRRRKSQARALVIPPSSPGSLGDEAVLNAFVGLLREHGIRDVGIVSYRREDQWEHVRGVSHRLVLHDHFRGGSLGALVRFAAKARRYGRVYLLGTDVIDGHYNTIRSLRRIELVRTAARVGVMTSIVGCSFNDAAPAQVIAALRSLPEDVRICCRDPISQSATAAALGRAVELVADPAVLLPADHDAECVRCAAQWVTVQRDRARTVLGVNVNHLLLNADPSLSRQSLVDAFVETISELHEHQRSLSFCLIPHDSRGEVSDVALAQSVFDALPAQVRDSSYLVQFPITAAQAKAIVSYVDCVFSGKMHLAIACLSQCIPVGCITYQGRKFEGLFCHFGLEGVTVEPHGSVNPAVLVPFIRSIIDRRDALREQIRARLPAVRALAMKNCELALPATLNGEPMVGA